MSKEFGNRLRHLRKEKRLTSKEFGNRFGLAESTISGYENGTRSPSLELVSKFSDFFDVTVDYLLNGDESPNEDESNRHIDKTVRQVDNFQHLDESTGIDAEWKDLYDKVMEKGAKIEATAMLRAVADGRMSKKKLEALLLAFDFIEKDDE